MFCKWLRECDYRSVQPKQSFAAQMVSGERRGLGFGGTKFFQRFGSSLEAHSTNDTIVHASALGKTRDAEQGASAFDTMDLRLTRLEQAIGNTQAPAASTRGQGVSIEAQLEKSREVPPDMEDGQSLRSFIRQELAAVKDALGLLKTSEQPSGAPTEVMRSLIQQELQPLQNLLVLEVQSCKGECLTNFESIQKSLDSLGVELEEYEAHHDDFADLANANLGDEGQRPIATDRDEIMTAGVGNHIDKMRRHTHKMEGGSNTTLILSDEDKHKQLQTVWKHMRAAIGWHEDFVGKYSHISTSELEPTNRFQEMVLKVTNHMAFQVIMAVLIMSNCTIIAIEADQAIRNALKSGKRNTEWAKKLDLFFTPAFCLELILRILGEHAYFFWGPTRSWNLFDTIVVLSAVLELLFDTFNFTFMRIMRVFRMLKVMRVIRIFRVFRELRLMVVSIITSMLTLTWAFLLLLLLIFCFAVCFVQAAANFLEQESSISDRTKTGVDENFSSLSHAIYTLLSVISGGKDWEGTATLLNIMHPMYLYLFVFYIVFVIFGVMNVLTGVFVDSAAEISKFDHDLVLQTEMSRKESFMNQVEGLFRQLDTDFSGTISWDELAKALADERIRAYLSHLELDVSEAKGLFRLLDTDNNGEIGAEEFMLGCMRLKGHSKGIEMASMMYDQRKMSLSITHRFDTISEDLRKTNLQLEQQTKLLDALGKRKGVRLVSGLEKQRSEKTEDEQTVSN